MTDLRRVERWLRTTFPPPCPVKVRVVARLKEADGAHLYGITTCASERCTVLVSRDQRPEVLYETLLHEWAHVLTLPALDAAGKDDHDDLFWIVFGRIYVAWHDRGGAEAATQLRL